MILRTTTLATLRAVFNLKTLAFLVFSCWFLASGAQAQVTDTVYQKPSLQNGMPPAEEQRPVIIKAPEKEVRVPDTTQKVKVKVKEEEYKERIPFSDRFFTGGGFGLSFGTYTNIQLAPVLGYKITDWLGAGVGLTYIYIGDRFYSENYLGKKVFMQGMIYKGVFGHIEYENFSSFEDKYNVSATLGGLGYRQMVSNKVGIDLMLLLNLNNSVRSAYTDPLVYRFGFYIEL